MSLHCLDPSRQERAYPLLVASEIVIPQSRIYTDDVVRRSLCQDRVNPVLGVLNVLFHKSDRQDLLLLARRSARGRRHPTVQERVEFLEDGGFERSGVLFVSTDI